MEAAAILAIGFVVAYNSTPLKSLAKNLSVLCGELATQQLGVEVGLQKVQLLVDSAALGLTHMNLELLLRV